MTDVRTEPPEALMDEAPPNDRTLRLNDVAIRNVRREVAEAVAAIDGALARLREVLNTRLPELRADSTDDD